MPRKKAESDDESTSVKRRTRTKSQAVEETAAAEAQAAPAEAADGEETQVKKKRSYARKPAAAEGEEETKPRRGRKKKEEAEAAAAPEAAEAEEQKPAKRGRRVKEADEPRQETIFGAEEGGEARPEEPKAEEPAAAAQPEEPQEPAAEYGAEQEPEAEYDEAPVSEEPSEQPAEAEAPQPEIQRNERGQIRHQHPKLGFSQLAGETLAELRKIAKDTGVTSITTRRKDDLINDILKTQAEALGYRYNGGTLECMPEGYGFLRPSGLLPSSNDIYVSASQIRRFGLRNGDVVWGIIRPPKDQEHYEALLRVENVNFTDPEEARRRPHFEALTPIFPNEKLQLETDRRQIATRIVDIFAPIGKGQRALIVRPSRGRASPRRGPRARKGEAPRRSLEGRRAAARLHHAPRARLKPRRPALRTHALRRYGPRGALLPEEILRRGAQHRERRKPYDNRHVARRDRQPHGRRNI